MYSPDRYETTELMHAIEAERRKISVPRRCFGWLLGLTYLTVGLFGWERLAQEWSIRQQIGYFLLALLAWPVVIAVFDAFIARIADWPRCPVCGKKLAGFSPALRRCPRCRSIIVADLPLTGGYTLPGEAELQPPPGRRNSVSIGMLVGQLLIFGVIFLPVLLCTQLLGIVDRTAGLMLLCGRALAEVGMIMILIFGIWPDWFEKLLLLVARIDAKCDRLNRKLDKNYRSVITDPARLCPVCGREPDHRLVAVTGHCPMCGAHIHVVSPEPDSAAMMDRRLVG